MKKEKTNLFDVVPYISEHIMTEKENELSVIVFLRFKSKFMRRFFIPKNKSCYIRVKLEEHGTAVWNLIDGIRTVSEIVDLLSDHFQNEENYEYRIVTYISQLQTNGFIKYRISESKK